MLSKNKILTLTSVSLFFIPILAFLNKINLPQILLFDIYLIVISQILLLIFVFFLSFICQKFLLKSIIRLELFFLVNAVTVYLLFFFRNVESLFHVLIKQNFILDKLSVLLIYIFLYFFLIKFIKKYFDFLLRFLIIYIFLQFAIFFTNIFNFQLNSNEQNVKTYNLNSLTEFNANLIKENSNSEAIFFIILDGMMSLNSAEKLKIIKNKKEIIKSLKKNNLEYKNNFFTNYNSTYLSISSLLQSSYPVTEKSKKYYNRNNFFPNRILNPKKNNNFLNILKKTNKKFMWAGNSAVFCQNNLYIRCINSGGFYKIFTKIQPFYYDSIFFYLFKFNFNNNNKKNSLNFLTSTNTEFKNNEIYLIHVLNPHPPYVFDKNCNIKNNNQTIDFLPNKEIENYSYAYNCLIDIVNNWTNKIDKINKNHMIFIMGDHGWSFDEETMQSHNLSSEESRRFPFFSYKIPSRCDKITKPNSIVNVMRFALICAGNENLKYLKDLKFKSFYEDHSDYGKVILIK